MGHVVSASAPARALDTSSPGTSQARTGLHAPILAIGPLTPNPHGSGTQCLVALAQALEVATGGLLLLDELGAGIHHSLFKDVWQLLVETALQRDLQIIATTHSRDCLTALGDFYRGRPELHDTLSVHRLDRSLSKSIRYSADDLRIIVEQRMEIR
ncbi:hypothetical protein D7V88_40970 [Corallococcus terminator]|uniref:ATPase AAA-type core domain-containing protein n=2 Tax=Corallococcus terminator TaxID=2316733 RepID=A0A3A8HAJ4_9BACT|nr:hypothetical protein D7V88_40970 [Corallococcus terminator]